MKSLPSATGSMRVASATAAPPLLPPALFDGSYALRVTPNTSLKVCEPSPNSGVLLLPITMQPAAFMRDAMRPSSRATNSRIRGEPRVVGRPCTAARSLMACGMPCIQPMLPVRDLPGASCVSRSSACASRWSGSCRLTSALWSGLTWAMRSRYACITSRQETRRAWMARDSSVAVQAVMGLPGCELFFIWLEYCIRSVVTLQSSFVIAA